jgi:hypothetical protein
VSIACQTLTFETKDGAREDNQKANKTIETYKKMVFDLKFEKSIVEKRYQDLYDGLKQSEQWLKDTDKDIESKDIESSIDVLALSMEDISLGDKGLRI